MCNNGQPDQTTTYSLVAICGSTIVQQQVTVNVEVPSGCSGVPIIESFTANPSTMAPGETTTLQWRAVENATTAALASPQGKKGVGTPGEWVVEPNQTATYALGAYCGNQIAKLYVTVVVQGPHEYSGVPNIAFLIANSPVISRGATSALQYGPVTNASGAFLRQPDGIIGVSTAGETTVQPDITSVYSLYALCGPIIIQERATVTVR